jgi:hypothetical protein
MQMTYRERTVGRVGGVASAVESGGIRKPQRSRAVRNGLAVLLVLQPASACRAFKTVLIDVPCMWEAAWSICLQVTSSEELQALLVRRACGCICYTGSPACQAQVFRQEAPVEAATAQVAAVLAIPAAHP